MRGKYPRAAELNAWPVHKRRQRLLARNSSEPSPVFRRSSLKSLKLKPREVDESSEHSFSIHYEPKALPPVSDIERAETRAERDVVERRDKEIANCRIKMANA